MGHCNQPLFIVTFVTNCKRRVVVALKKQRKPADGFILESFLPYRLSLLSNTVSQGISTAYRRDYGLSVTEWRIIAVLGRFPGLTASQITERTAMDKVAVSRAVKKLRHQGLVHRSPHRHDRRRQPMELTADKGRALFEQVVPKALAYERRLLSKLSEEEIEVLSALLTRLQRSAASIDEASA